VTDTPLTPDQEAEAERLYQALRRAADQDLRGLARLLAAKPDGQLLGATEFEVRDRAHRIGAAAIQAALDKVALGLLDGHAHTCVVGARTEEKEERTAEMMAAVGRLLRRG